jgi:hypothetical protein
MDSNEKSWPDMALDKLLDRKREVAFVCFLNSSGEGASRLRAQAIGGAARSSTPVANAAVVL